MSFRLSLCRESRIPRANSTAVVGSGIGGSIGSTGSGDSSLSQVLGSIIIVGVLLMIGGLESVPAARLNVGCPKSIAERNDPPPPKPGPVVRLPTEPASLSGNS